MTNSVLTMGARNPFQAREVTSRRGGPAKQPLSRDAIVTEALELLRREGLAGMSLRKVAAALDTGPASLYAYVEDLQELRALVCDRALAGVDTAGERAVARAPGGGWQHRLIALLRSYLQVLAQSPGLAQLAMSTIAAGPNALRIIEALLSLLDEAGVDRATAAWAVDLLLLYVTALAAEQSQRRDEPDPLGPIARAIGAVSPQEHPHTYAAREDLLSGGPERMTWALQVLLKGILQTPRDSITPSDSGAAPRLSKPRKPARGR
ncbi:TetR/AcrR family transcriptional regulator [Sorangium sp. So ce1151]|uniref:TetR/AcrR family transcriptional regulator n=1 Tax=Sorangium sp. So ce1151 TaxID=3133332 RepID=UPI003F60183C